MDAECLMRCARSHFFASRSMKKFQELDSLISYLKVGGSNQRTFWKLTFGDEEIIKFPVKLSHQKSFMKLILDKLESSGCEIDDLMYETYCQLLQKEKENNLKVQYHHFCIPNAVDSTKQRSIKIKCDENFLSSGTTGLSLWQAGFTLAEWCLENEQQLNSKCILELGSGSGFTGLVVAALSQAKYLVLTDGHDKVLEQLQENVELNFPCLRESDTLEKLHSKKTEISVMKLDWDNVSSFHVPYDPDIILAADIVYDPSAFDGLRKTFLHFLTKNEALEAILACTLRNQDTLNEFFKSLGTNISIAVKDLPSKQYFVYDNEFPVYIYSLRLAPKIKI